MVKKHLFLWLCLLIRVCHPTPPAEEENPEFWRKQARESLRSALNRKLNTNVAKNIIIFLGDGMGITTITAARILKGQQQHREGSVVSSRCMNWGGI